MWRRWYPCALLEETNGIAATESNMGVPQKTRTICTPMFIASILTIAKKWKQPKSSDEWMNKTWSWRIHVIEYYLTLKRRKSVIYCTGDI